MKDTESKNWTGGLGKGLFDLRDDERHPGETCKYVVKQYGS